MNPPCSQERPNTDTVRREPSCSAWRLPYLNVHLHCVIPDGVFVREKGAIRFVPLGAPPIPRWRRSSGSSWSACCAPPCATGGDGDGKKTARRAGERADRNPPASGCRRRSPCGGDGLRFPRGFSLHAGVHLHATTAKGWRSSAATERVRRSREAALALRTAASPTLSVPRRRPRGPRPAAAGAAPPLGDAGAAAPPSPRALPRCLRAQLRLACRDRPATTGIGAAACPRRRSSHPPGESPASTAAERPSSGRQTRIPWSELSSASSAEMCCSAPAAAGGSCSRSSPTRRS